MGQKGDRRPMNDKWFDAVDKLTLMIQDMVEDESVSCSICPASDFCTNEWANHKACHAVLKAWVRKETKDA